MRYSTVIWDLDEDARGNVAHCAEHGVTKEEVEAAIRYAERLNVSNTTGEPILFGWTGTGKHIAGILEVVDEDTVFPVIAYECKPRGGQ